MKATAKTAASNDNNGGFGSGANNTNQPGIGVTSVVAGFGASIDTSKFDLTVISPRNHFIFTPLLPSAAVGTLEFRCIQEPIRTIKNLHFYQAKARALDVKNQVITCQNHFKQEKVFEVPYDYLVMSNGAMTNTFNTPGVNYGENNVYFLKDLQHARSIRNRILECFERASYPNATKEDIDRLLTFVIVGGGPISVEFAGELHSFLKKDISKWYPEFQNRVNVQIIEAGKHILGPFNPSLVAYAEDVISKKGMNLKTGVAVQEVREHEVELKDGTVIPCGIVVWSTGVKPTRFISTL